MDLIEEVKQILDGIDRESCDGTENQWWETSSGAEFGKERLDLVIEAIEKHYKDKRCG
jgi:hypothetical protein